MKVGKVGPESFILQPVVDDRMEMLEALAQLLGYVSLDAEELEATELAEAIDRAIVIATEQLSEAKVA